LPATVPTAGKQEKEMIKNHQKHTMDIYRKELVQEKQRNRALLHTLTHVCTHTHAHAHTLPTQTHTNTVVCWTEMSAFLW